MPGSNLQSLQPTDAFPITPSNTLNLKDDPANTGTPKYTFCTVHNPAAGGTVRVLPASAPDDDLKAVTIYIPQGGVSQIAVKRIYSGTPTPPTGLVAFIGKGGSF